MIHAVINHDLKCLEWLISAGVDLNVHTRKANTALNISIRRGHFDMVELLIKAGVDVNVQDGGDNTALTAAIKICQVQYLPNPVILSIIQAGAE